MAGRLFWRRVPDRTTFFAHCTAFAASRDNSIRAIVAGSRQGTIARVVAEMPGTPKDMPVELISTDPPDDRTLAGTALCLSGGGYRAMVFHTGVLWRLYEAGLLAKVDRISSVSGGSIIAGVLALAWKTLSFDPKRTPSDFVPQVVEPIRRMAIRPSMSVQCSSAFCFPDMSATGLPPRMTRCCSKGDSRTCLITHGSSSTHDVQSGALWHS
jgi:NTE family protein